MGPGLFTALFILVITGFALVAWCFWRTALPSYVPMPYGPDFDRQAVFEKVAAHLITQGRRAGKFQAGYGKWSCKYRMADEPLTCAIGCLISEECYDKSFEGELASSENVVGALACSLDIPKQKVWQNRAFLEDLQSIHDKKEPESWRHHLRVFARTHALKVPVWL